MKTKNTKIKVKQNEENQVPVQIIADAIVSISKGIKKLLSGPLSEKALVILITEACPKMGKGYTAKSVTATGLCGFPQACFTCGVFPLRTGAQRGLEAVYER